MHCDQTVHVSADLSLWLDNPMFSAACPSTPGTHRRLSPVPPGKRGGVWMCKLGEELKANDDK